MKAKHLYLLALLFLLGAGVKYLSDQPFFQIQKIDVVAEDGGKIQRASKKEIFQSVLPYLSGSFFKVDIKQAAQAASENSWVQVAHIERSWFNAVRVKVREYQPFAYWLHNGEQVGLLNASGEAFQAKFSDKLPEFDGEEAQLPEMVQQYQLFSNELAKAKLRIQRLQYSARGAWTLYLSNGVEVRLGAQTMSLPNERSKTQKSSNEPMARLKRFVYLWQTQLNEEANNIAYVDTRYPHAIAVRYRNGSEQLTENQKQ